MPPHARMSLAQQLLLRALVARFWREPYARRLTRWGTELHDRFMLPYFVGLDFEDVIEELRRAGYPLSSDWFAPHFEFRFPLAGELSARAIHLTLRQALEPWHVLGEEGVGRRHGALRRFVARAPAGAGHRADRRSLRDHLQRPAAAAAADRTQRRVRRRRPLPRLAAAVGAAPDDSGARAAHLRLVDTWMERSVAGCQYHVMHPGGRNYEQFPVNSYEAESRRLARFTRLAHTPGRVPRRPSGAEPASFRTRSTCEPDAVTRARRCSPDYVVPDGHFDELRTDDGALRQPWAEFAASTELTRRVPVPGAEARRPADPRERRHLQRLRRPPTGRTRPWSLDVLPLIVPAPEWERARPRPAAARAAAERASPPTSTARRRCCATGWCRRRWSSGIRGSCAPATASGRRRRLPASGRVRSRARRRRRLAGRRHPHAGAVRRSATRSRTARSSRACFPTRSARCASTRCRRSSASCGRCCSPARPSTATRRTSSC